MGTSEAFVAACARGRGRGAGGQTLNSHVPGYDGIRSG